MLKIATDLGRSPSTISRKINRNGGVAGYRAAKADARAWDWARRPKRCALALNGRLRFIIASKLSQEWSPVQISGWLSFTYPDDESLHVSHERIYKSLFVQSRGVLKKELQAHLRPSVFFANLERIIREGMREAALLTPSRSQNLRPKSRIEPSQVTGRAI
jgi:IS30 family transposase